MTHINCQLNDSSVILRQLIFIKWEGLKRRISNLTICGKEIQSWEKHKYKYSMSCSEVDPSFCKLGHKPGNIVEGKIPQNIMKSSHDFLKQLGTGGGSHREEHRDRWGAVEKHGAVGGNNVMARPLYGDHRLLEPQDSQSQQDSTVGLRTEILEKPSEGNSKKSLSHRI